MRTREECLEIIRNALGGNISTGSPAGKRVRTRDDSLRILQSAVTEPAPSVILNREAVKNPENRTPGAENDSPMFPNDVGATLAVARPNGSPSGGAGGSPSTETKPMGYGGGGTAGGGGGRGGRADERTALQEQLNELDEAAAYVTTTEQSDGIERQRRPLIEQLRRMDEEEGKSGVYTAGDRLKNAGANAKLMVQQGLTIADHNIAQTADWLFGGIAKEGRALLNTTLQSINPEWGFEIVEEYKANPNRAFARHTISQVTECHAKDAENLLGGSYTGFTNAINANGIKHILKEHGENGVVDHSMADVNDLARIAYVLDNYDTVNQATYASGNIKYGQEF